MSKPRETSLPAWIDPIVAEVHATRKRIVESVDGDLHALCEQLRARQAAAGRTPVPGTPGAPQAGRGEAA